VPDLRAAIAVDYQNVHLTGHGRFKSTRDHPKHEALIDPLHFANQLLQVRNSRQRGGRPPAVLRAVDVYRGLPSSEHHPDAYARNLAQKAHWERDQRVSVTHRPLRYRYMRDASGRPLRDPATGIKIPDGPPTEKGVDVMCALALLRHARREDIDLVVLASLDSDLIPALDEVVAMGERVETFSWWSPNDWSFEMRLSDRSKRIWNTRLGEQEFLRCMDRTEYA
jgi:uncharacterized LabA/DUF88 family protein